MSGSMYTFTKKKKIRPFPGRYNLQKS